MAIVTPTPLVAMVTPTPIVYWLRTIRPHIWTLCEVYVAGMQAGLGLVVEECVVGSHQIHLPLALLKHIDAW